MAYEVEMKAWVDDWPGLEAVIRQRCVFQRAFRKTDRYFRLRSPLRRLVSRTRFRLRIDDRATYVTYKDKRLRGSAEINLEREFAVDDTDAFVELASRLGFAEFYGKVKEGLRFAYDDLVVEISRVEGLGAFLEVEYLDENSDASVHGLAADRISAFIADCGIDPSRIEPRPYQQLLREARHSRRAHSR